MEPELRVEMARGPGRAHALYFKDAALEFVSFSKLIQNRFGHVRDTMPISYAHMALVPERKLNNATSTEDPHARRNKGVHRGELEHDSHLLVPHYFRVEARPFRGQNRRFGNQKMADVGLKSADVSPIWSKSAKHWTNSAQLRPNSARGRMRDTFGPTLAKFGRLRTSSRQSRPRDGHTMRNMFKCRRN